MLKKGINYKRSFCQQLLLNSTLTASFLSAVGSWSSMPAQARPLGAAPGNSQAGASRGACFTPDKDRVLTALVDKSDPALTTQGNPTFVFYLPYGRDSFSSQDGQDYSVATAEFELQDENEKSVLKNQKIVLAIPEKPGIVKLTLPKTEAPLKLNQEYFWSFRIMCDPNDNTSNPRVSGWIKRVAPNASGTVWFDRLAQVVQSPTNQLAQWTELLKPFNLQDLSGSAIVELKPQEELRTSGQGSR